MVLEVKSNVRRISLLSGTSGEQAKWEEHLGGSPEDVDNDGISSRQHHGEGVNVVRIQA